MEDLRPKTLYEALLKPDELRAKRENDAWIRKWLQDVAARLEGERSEK